MEQQAAELDYRFKVHARQVREVLDILSDTKSRIAKTGHVAEE